MGPEEHIPTSECHELEGKEDNSNNIIILTILLPLGKSVASFFRPVIDSFSQPLILSVSISSSLELSSHKGD